MGCATRNNIRLGLYTSCRLVYILAVVPQRSFYGPILIVLYFNDSVNAVRSIIRLFAYDTSFFVVADNSLASAVCLNTDISRPTIDWLPLGL